MAGGGGGGKSKEVVDLIYEENQRPGSRRNVRRDPDWSAAEDTAIVHGVEKYRHFGFSLKTTVEIVKKDRVFHGNLSARTVQGVCNRFHVLVGLGMTVALQSNSDIADLLAADGHTADGGGDTFVLGQLFEKFIDITSARLARNSAR